MSFVIIRHKINGQEDILWRMLHNCKESVEMQKIFFKDNCKISSTSDCHEIIIKFKKFTWIRRMIIVVLLSCIGPNNLRIRLTNVKLLHSMYSRFSPTLRCTLRSPIDSKIPIEARPKNFKSFCLNRTVLISMLLVSLLYLGSR